jgi:hypothetical protein
MPSDFHTVSLLGGRQARSLDFITQNAYIPVIAARAFPPNPGRPYLIFLKQSQFIIANQCSGPQKRSQFRVVRPKVAVQSAPARVRPAIYLGFH